MKILGIILIAFGLVDLVGSYTGFDLWGGFLGINLPELLWKFSSYIEIGAGYLLMKLGESEPKESQEDVEQQT